MLLLQFQLNDSQIEEINKGNLKDLYNLYTRCHAFCEIESVKEAYKNGHYKVVARIDTDDKDEAFRLCNLWNEPERIEKRSERVRSMSVGDILIVGTQKFVVSNVGFERI